MKTFWKLTPILFSVMIYWTLILWMLKGEAPMDTQIITAIIAGIVTLAAVIIAVIAAVAPKLGKILSKLEILQSELEKMQQKEENDTDKTITKMDTEHGSLTKQQEAANNMLSFLRDCRLEDNVKNEKVEERYKNLDMSGRDIVEAVQKLQDFSGAFQLINTKLIELERELAVCREQVRTLEAEKNASIERKQEQEQEFGN